MEEGGLVADDKQKEEVIDQKSGGQESVIEKAADETEISDKEKLVVDVNKTEVTAENSEEKQVADSADKPDDAAENSEEKHVTDSAEKPGDAAENSEQEKVAETVEKQDDAAENSEEKQIADSAEKPDDVAKNSEEEKVAETVEKQEDAAENSEEKQIADSAEKQDDAAEKSGEKQVTDSVETTGEKEPVAETSEKQDNAADNSGKEEQAADSTEKQDSAAENSEKEQIVGATENPDAAETEEQRVAEPTSDEEKDAIGEKPSKEQELVEDSVAVNSAVKHETGAQDEAVADSTPENADGEHSGSVGESSEAHLAEKARAAEDANEHVAGTSEPNGDDSAPEASPKSNGGADGGDSDAVEEDGRGSNALGESLRSNSQLGGASHLQDTHGSGFLGDNSNSQPDLGSSALGDSHGSGAAAMGTAQEDASDTPRDNDSRNALEVAASPVDESDFSTEVTNESECIAIDDGASCEEISPNTQREGVFIQAFRQSQDMELDVEPRSRVVVSLTVPQMPGSPQMPDSPQAKEAAERTKRLAEQRDSLAILKDVSVDTRCVQDPESRFPVRGSLVETLQASIAHFTKLNQKNPRTQYDSVRLAFEEALKSLDPGIPPPSEKLTSGEKKSLLLIFRFYSGQQSNSAYVRSDYATFDKISKASSMISRGAWLKLAKDFNFYHLSRDELQTIFRKYSLKQGHRTLNFSQFCTALQEVAQSFERLPASLKPAECVNALFNHMEIYSQAFQDKMRQFGQEQSKASSVPAGYPRQSNPRPAAQPPQASVALAPIEIVELDDRHREMLSRWDQREEDLLHRVRGNQ